MEKIATYNISRLRKIFESSGNGKDFLLVDEQHYTPSTEEPFRTDTYAIAFIKKGNLRVTTGLNTVVMKGPALLTIGPSVIRSIEKVDEKPQLDLLFFKEGFFLETQANIFSLLKFTFFEEGESHVLNLSPTLSGKVTTLFDGIKETLAGRGPDGGTSGNDTLAGRGPGNDTPGTPHPHEAAIVRSYIHILLCEIDAAGRQQAASGQETSAGQQAASGQQAATGKTSPLVANFKALLARESLQQRSVRFYADHLHVTPKHLSELVKTQTGRTAGEWIDQMVVLEAKVLLQKMELTISQVADLLNFSDQSVFGKFFKVNTGMSPLHYRNSLG